MDLSELSLPFFFQVSRNHVPLQSKCVGDGVVFRSLAARPWKNDDWTMNFLSFWVERPKISRGELLDFRECAFFNAVGPLDMFPYLASFRFAFFEEHEIQKVTPIPQLSHQPIHKNQQSALQMKSKTNKTWEIHKRFLGSWCSVIYPPGPKLTAMSLSN